MNIPMIRLVKHLIIDFYNSVLFINKAAVAFIQEVNYTKTKIPSPKSQCMSKKIAKIPY